MLHPTFARYSVARYSGAVLRLLRRSIISPTLASILAILSPARCILCSTSALPRSLRCLPNSFTARILAFPCATRAPTRASMRSRLCLNLSDERK